MPEHENDCCCCDIAADLTLVAWDSWAGALPPEASAEDTAALIAAMYAKIHPVVSKNCTCGCQPSE